MLIFHIYVYLLGLTKTLKSPLSTNPKASSNSSPVEKAIRSPSSSNKEKKTYTTTFKQMSTFRTTDKTQYI